MKKAITITFGLIGLIFGLVFSSTKIEASEIILDIDTPISELKYKTLRQVFENGNLYTLGDKTLHAYASYSGQMVTLMENHYYYVNRIAEPISPYTVKDNQFGKITVLQPELFNLLDADQVVGYSSGIRQFPYATQENISIYFYGIYGYDGIDTAIFKNVHLLDITSLGIDDLTVGQIDYYYQQYSKSIVYKQGYQEGISSTYYDGFGGFINPDTNEPYDETTSFPYGQGYNKGFDDALISTESGGLWGLLFSALLAPFQVLGTELLPGVTIGMIVAVPLVFGLLAWILSAGKSKK